MTRKNIHQSELFDSLKTVELINSRKTRLEVLNYGAALFSLKFMRPDGEYLNAVVSPEKPEDFLAQDYWKHNKCFGASVGRYAGRISNGGFSLNGEDYSLYTNNGIHLHGGKFGFTYKFWEIEEIKKHDNPSVRLSYLSKDGEEGYPGNMKVSVTYTLTDEDVLKIEYSATTDKDTVVNLTNHAYFNLNGGGDITDHLLYIPAEEVLEADESQFPTGGFVSLINSRKDFSTAKPLGEIPLDDVFVLNKSRKEEVVLKGTKSGLTLKIETNQPAVVVYAPEELPTDWDYQTQVAAKHPSVCLETQNFPDAPNHSKFPSSVLKSGEVYSNKMAWSFRFEDQK